jgi:hypothetical protein
MWVTSFVTAFYTRTTSDHRARGKVFVSAIRAPISPNGDFQHFRIKSIVGGKKGDVGEQFGLRRLGAAFS